MLSFSIYYISSSAQILTYKGFSKLFFYESDILTLTVIQPKGTEHVPQMNRNTIMRRNRFRIFHYASLLSSRVHLKKEFVRVGLELVGPFSLTCDKVFLVNVEAYLVH